MDNPLKNVYVNKTSGSSGHPFIFAKDKLCHALTWAEILIGLMVRIDFNSTLQARFYGILSTGLAIKRTDQRPIKCSIPVSHFDLSDKKKNTACFPQNHSIISMVIQAL